MNHEPQTFVDLQDTGNAQSQLVFQAIARHANWDTGECYPRVEVLARMSKCSDKTVRRHMKRLKTDGFIGIYERARDDGSQGANLIVIVGYADWIKANRAGGKVAKPKAAKRYREDDLGTDADADGQQNGPGQSDHGAGQVDHAETPETALDNLPKAVDEMTRGAGQQVSNPKNTFSELLPPKSPNGGPSANPVDEQWKAAALDGLRAGGRHGLAVEHLIAPLLRSDKRLSLGKGAERNAVLAEIAEAASGLSIAALEAAAKRIIEQPKKVTPSIMRGEVDHARRGGAMFVIRPSMPQWSRWLEHYDAANPQLAKIIRKDGTSWQVPSEWPPSAAASERGAA